MLKLDIQAYSIHKAGTEASYYEDAFAFDAKMGRAAVADGASESFEARDWASLLTQKFVKVPPSPDTNSFLEWLEIPKKVWHVILPWEELPWYAEQKAREVGGLATLLGFYLATDNGEPLGEDGAKENRARSPVHKEATAAERGDEEVDTDTTAYEKEDEESEGFVSELDLRSLLPDDDEEDVDLRDLIPEGGTVQSVDLLKLLPKKPSVPKAPATMRWSAMAVGDACLFHIRDNNLLKRFPLEEVAAFGTTPALLSTVGTNNREMLEQGELHLCEGECRPGDIFLLATDALAERFYDLADLAELQIGLPDWNSLLQIIEDDFENLVAQFREDSLMRNDDVTLLVIHVKNES